MRKEETLLAFVKNSFVPLSSAQIPITDRGFRYGDGVFETIRVSQGIAYQLEQHLKRLYCGLDALCIPHPSINIKEICYQLITINHLENGFLRLTITRGTSGFGYLPSSTSSPLVVAQCGHHMNKSSENFQPLKIWLSSIRRPDSRSIPNKIKTLQGLPSILARIEAEENDCGEALLLGPNGELCEGSSTNIFWVKDGILYTPSLELPIVAGTIRDTIIRINKSNVRTGVFTLDDLISAQEVMLTNTNWLVRGVSQLLPGNQFKWNPGFYTNKLFNMVKQDIISYVETK